MRGRQRLKRHGNLSEQVISFEALLRAAEQARKGKRFRPAVASFHFDQERALWKLNEELSTKTYRPGAYRSFFICEPKKRQISAAPYRDRVVHHALVNVLEPIYERTFHHHPVRQLVLVILSPLRSGSTSREMTTAMQG